MRSSNHDASADSRGVRTPVRRSPRGTADDRAAQPRARSKVCLMCRWRSDAELLAAALEDGEAFGEFYDRHVAWVLAFFRRRVFEPELALDLAAETFAGALASVAGFEPAVGDAHAWLFAIARHKLADAIRSRQVQDCARRALAMQPVAVDDEALATIERLAARGALELLDELPPQQRQGIAARHLEGREYTEIALELRCSESVVRKRVSRGLAALRRAALESGFS